MKILATLLLVPSLGLAQSVYKCPSDEGRFILQQTPCKEGQEIAVKPLTSGNGGDSSALLQYGKKLETERVRAEQERILAIKTKNERKAIEESITAYGIKDGRSWNDRLKDMYRSDCNNNSRSSSCGYLREMENR